MKKIIGKTTVIGVLFVSALGTAAHFFYDWSHQNWLAGLVTPVNESTWEHMKLLFFPMLLYTFLVRLSRRQKEPFPYQAFYAGILAGTWLIPVLFYTVSGALGFHSAILDIAIFYVSVLAAFCICRKHTLSGCRNHPWLFYAVLLQASAFLLFTRYPPGLGLFQSP